MDLDGCCDYDDYSNREESDDTPSLGAAYVDAPEDGAGEEDESCVGDDVERCDGSVECILGAY